MFASRDGLTGVQLMRIPWIDFPVGTRLVTLRAITRSASSKPSDVLRVERRETHTGRVIRTAAGVLATHSRI